MIHEAFYALVYHSHIAVKKIIAIGLETTRPQAKKGNRQSGLSIFEYCTSRDLSTIQEIECLWSGGLRLWLEK